MSLKGEKTSISNANFAHKSFIETEFSHGNDAKKTWLAYQGYYYEDNPSGIDGANGRAEDVAERKRIVAASTEFRLFGKIACDFLSCDKHLISGVTIKPSLRRSPNDFVLMSEHRDKHYRVEITEANLSVRKMTVTDFLLSSIEKTLLKTPAIYNYIEVLPRTFLVTTGVQSWRKEDVFAKEPVRRMILAMSSNTAYLGTNQTNPFHYQKFQLNEIIVYRNCLPLQELMCQRLITKEYTTTHWKLYTLFLTIVMVSVWLIITIIILWHLISHLLRRLHMTLFILN